MTYTDFELGRLIVGCGTFGGIGGSAALIGKGLDDAGAFATLDEAVVLGLTMLDTAESYAGGASETIMRRWFDTRDPTTTASLRLTTKVAPPPSNEADQRFDTVYIACKFAGSLARLGVEHVDTLLVHAPDERTPVAVTLEGMEAVRATGECMHLGACNFDLTQLTAAIEAADRMGVRGYEMIQNGYSLLAPDDDHELRAVCHERGIVYTAFSPLAGGAADREVPARRTTAERQPAGAATRRNRQAADSRGARRDRPSRAPRRRTRCVVWSARDGLGAPPPRRRCAGERPQSYQPSPRDRGRGTQHRTPAGRVRRSDRTVPRCS